MVSKCTYIDVGYAFKFSRCLDELGPLARKDLVYACAGQLYLGEVGIACVIVSICSFHLSHLLESVVALSSSVLLGHSGNVLVVLRPLRPTCLGVARRVQLLGLDSVGKASSPPVHDLDTVV